MNGGRGPRAWLSRLGLLIGSLAIACGLAEIVARVSRPQVIQPRFVVDSGFGVRFNAPEVDTRHYVAGDYDVRITTNGAGLRGGAEYPVAKPAGAYRIALLGDSFVFGYGVTDDEVLSATLERRLIDEADQSGVPEVLNFGVSGFGQAEELVVYRNLARLYRPDAVAVFYYDNDPGNNKVSDLFQLEGDALVPTGRPFLPGVKAREVLYAWAPTRFLFTRSHAFNLARNWLSSKVQRRLLEERGLESFDDTDGGTVPLTVALLAELVGEIRRDGAWPIVFVIPRRSLESNFPLTAQEVKGLGADFLDGRDCLTADDYDQRDSHWRPSGHLAATHALADLLVGRSL